MFVRVLAFLNVTLLATALSTAQELDEALFTSYATASLAAYEVPGAAIAVVKNGEVVQSKGFGLRDMRHDAPVDGDTLFAIASNTKAFTAVLLATLVDEGKLDWDDRVTDHLPELRLFDTYATRELTLRDLLSHRSGNASGAGDLLWLRSTYSRPEIVHRIRFIPPAYGFRARYGYQNVMYIAAGELAGAVSGSTWDDLVRERVFEALEMRSTNTTIRGREAGANWATPHVRMDGRVQPIEPEIVDNLGGAGAINSSANDLSRWLLMLLGEGTLGTTRVFSEQQSEQMWTPHTVLPIGTASPKLAPRQPRFSAYGLGFRMKDYRGRKLVHHGGGLAGMTSLTTLVPEEELGIVVLTNQETSFQTAVTYWVLDRYFGAPETDWTALQQEAAEKRWRERVQPLVDAVDDDRVTGTAPTLGLSEYAGPFTDRLYGGATIEQRDGHLHLQLDKSPAFRAPLEHWHFDTFLARFDHHSIVDALVTFVIGVDGSVDRFRMKPYSPAADGATYHYEILRFDRADAPD